MSIRKGGKRGTHGSLTKAGKVRGFSPRRKEKSRKNKGPRLNNRKQFLRTLVLNEKFRRMVASRTRWGWVKQLCAEIRREQIIRERREGRGGRRFDRKRRRR